MIAISGRLPPTALLAVAARHNLGIIEDVAQANGGSYQGRRLGGIGNVGAFSLQFNKILTSGEGGLVTPNADAIADRIRREAGCKILLATKAWAMPAAFPLMRDHLDGTTASGEYEARMGFEEFGKEVHVYAPAYGPGEVERVLAYADHIYFNSPGQIAKYLPLVKKAGKNAGIRINPGYSNATLGGALYDPCAPGSRFGTTQAELDKLPWGEIDILPTHALYESLQDGSVG